MAHVGLQGPRPDPQVPRPSRRSSSASRILQLLSSGGRPRRRRMVAGAAGPHEAAGRSARAGRRPRSRATTSSKCRGWPRSRRSPTTCNFRRNTIPIAAIRRSSRSTARRPRPSSRSTGGPGAWTEAGWRAGQAARHGYIVIAPEWTDEHQKQYGYSAREHAAVLNSLRDACRRFRHRHRPRVPLGPFDGRRRGLGHRPGPSRPVGGRDSDRGPERTATATLYWENARYVPFYVVGGELDGDKLAQERPRPGPLPHSAASTPPWSSTWAAGTRTSTTRSCGCSTGWAASAATSSPASSACETMRPWDNYFWWVEMQRAAAAARWSIRPNWPPPQGAAAGHRSRPESTTATG